MYFLDINDGLFIYFIPQTRPELNMFIWFYASYYDNTNKLIDQLCIAESKIIRDVNEIRKSSRCI